MSAPTGDHRAGSSEPELWGIRKTLTIVIPLTALGALAAVLMIAKDTRLQLSKAKGGECVVLDAPLPVDDSVVKEFRRTGCSKAHNAEVYTSFRYPGTTTPGTPTPAETCSQPPAGITAAEAARVERFMKELDRRGAGRLHLTNKSAKNVDRDYVCLATFTSRTGRLLDEVVLAAATGP